jgi:hypothetical protein
MLTALPISLLGAKQQAPPRVTCLLDPFTAQGYYRRLYELVRAEAVKAGAAGVRLYADDSNARAHEAYKVRGRAGRGRYHISAGVQQHGVECPSCLASRPWLRLYLSPSPHTLRPAPRPQRLGMTSHYSVFEDMFVGY